VRSDNSVLDKAKDADNELNRKARDWLHLVVLVVEHGSVLSKLGFSKPKGLFRLGELRLALLHSTFEALNIIEGYSRELISDFG
jgi:hypothetical protein